MIYFFKKGSGRPLIDLYILLNSTFNCPVPSKTIPSICYSIYNYCVYENAYSLKNYSAFKERFKKIKRKGDIIYVYETGFIKSKILPSSKMIDLVLCITPE